MLTFLRTSEEAQVNVDKTYEYVTPVATLTGLTNAFDASTNTQVVTLEGTGFGSDTSGV